MRRYRIRIWSAAGAVLLAVALFLFYFGTRAPRFRTQSGLLGTVINMNVYESLSKKTSDRVFERVEEIHNLMGFSVPGSEVEALNQNSGVWTAVSPETAALLSRARSYAAYSDGAFDCTIAPVTELWGFSTGAPRYPDPAEIAARLPYVGYEGLQVDTGKNEVLLAPGAMVDLGSIAKGYACDEAVRILRAAGVQRAILDFGGNIYAMGKKDGDSGWKVGIRNPVIGESGIIAALEVSDTAVVTSGGYERFFEQDGAVFHHIMDPKTGYPADNGLISVTIICRDSTEADALSTACFVLGLEKGAALIEKTPGAEAVFVDRDKTVFVTSGISDSFSLYDDSFTAAGVK